MRLELLDIILIVLFFQLLTIVPFLLFQKTNRGVSNKIFGLFLLAKALCISYFLGFRLYKYTFEFFPHIIYFGSSFAILSGPLLYLYVKSLSRPDFKLLRKDIVHVIPFLIHFIFLTFSFHIKSAEMKRFIMENGGIYTKEVKIIYRCFLYSYTLVYSFAAFPIIKNYNLELRNKFSSAISKNLNWMNFIVTGFIFKTGFDIWYKIAESGSTSRIIAIYSSCIILFIFLNVMIYMGLKHPFIWSGVSPNVNKKKLALSKSLQDKYLEKLFSYTREYKPYLNPDISIEELANNVNIPARTLSWILNQRLNQNFNDFINSLRVKESERIFREIESNRKTIQEVLFEVGFNCKSSFNAAFKKHTNMTPTEFRKIKSR